MINHSFKILILIILIYVVWFTVNIKHEIENGDKLKALMEPYLPKIGMKRSKVFEIYGYVPIVSPTTGVDYSKLDFYCYQFKKKANLPKGGIEIKVIDLNITLKDDKVVNAEFHIPHHSPGHLVITKDKVTNNKIDFFYKLKYAIETFEELKSKIPKPKN